MTSTARLRPDDRSAPARWRQAGARLHTKLARFLRLAFKAGFDPNQPRSPAGQADGGQWTDGGGSFQVAQNVPRGGGRGRSSGGGRWSDVTPGQQMRLDVSRALADAAVARVRAKDPSWRPRPGVYETAEGQIANNQAIQREANARYVEIQTPKAGIGPYAVEGVPGPGPFRRPTDAQRDRVNEIGNRYGCHRCGTKDPGTSNGRWTYDHQGASALGGSEAGRWGYPHCVSCRASQGGIIRNILRYQRNEKAYQHRPALFPSLYLRPEPWRGAGAERRASALDRYRNLDHMP